MEAVRGPLGLTERIMRIVAAVCLAGMAAMTGVDVFMRGAFNTPLFGCEEIVSILRNWTAGDLGSIATSIGVIVHFLATHPEEYIHKPGSLRCDAHRSG